jgi:Squalene-hopene cyclase C-terminal domain/Prenyltransferase and squalene oxidase repeat
VSWQLASFLILAAVLLGGFAWYERSRPTSQVVALVAALAALAVAGRVAFVALPNVVATTDVVVFSGYALGAAPGFAVGALAGLVANFWLGQGPWTPWQMAGWGICGLMGALLALGVRNAGRMSLAATCGLAAVLYGALLNFSLMATYGGELSLERFVALESAAVPFDAAHAAGNVALALVAGPAMVRMLTRFRERFEWRAPAVASVLLLALALATALPAGAEAADTDRAVAWLNTAQNGDGGWGASPEDESAADITAWAMLGLAAAGRNPHDVTSSRGRSPVEYLRANLADVRSPGDLARTVLALEGAGANPRNFGGRDLVAALAKRRRSNGSYEGWPGSTAYAVLAMRAGGGGGIQSSISWLIKVQNRDGGWGDTTSSQSTADGTGAVLQALPNSNAAKAALRYLRKVQRPNGGFALGGGGVNSQSTAWATQGMIAAGAGVGEAQRYLTARQEEDGHFRYSASSDQTPVWVTGQALAAASGKAFPVEAPARQTQPGSSRLDVPGEGDSTPAPSSPGSSGAPPSAGDLLESFGGGSSAPPASGGEFPSVPGAPPSAGAPGGAIPPPAPPPGTSPEGASPEPAPAAPPFEKTASAGPKPLAPIGVGLGAGGLALGGVLFLGRRFGW